MEMVCARWKKLGAADEIVCQMTLSTLEQETTTSREYHAGLPSSRADHWYLKPDVGITWPVSVEMRHLLENNFLLRLRLALVAILTLEGFDLSFLDTLTATQDSWYVLSYINCNQ